MRSTRSLPLLPGPQWPGVVAHDKVLSIGQIDLIFSLILNWIVLNRTVLILNCVNKNLYLHLTELFELSSKYINLALNDLKGLTRRKIYQPTNF